MTKATCHVLLIDDNPDDRADLRQMLLRGSARRYRFSEAGLGAEALVAIAQAGPAAFDCILLDYHLPDMTAQELLAALCAGADLPPCPVLVVTGSDQVDGPRLLRSGAQDHIGKAWTGPESLTRALENAIERFELQRDRQRGQVALALERERLALALTAGRMGVFELGLDDGHLWWSPEVFALFGVTAGSFKPSRATFRALVHPDDRNLPWQGATPGGPPGQTRSVAFRILRPDGGLRWIAHCSQTLVDAAGQQHCHGVAVDITERKLAEADRDRLDQRLRDQQFYTRSLIEASQDAQVMTDPAGIVSDVNRQMELLTGCSREELIGSPFRNHFADPQRADASLALALRQLLVTDFDLTVRARDGRQTEVSLNASTLYDRERTLLGVFVSARDVAQRRFLDRALQETNAALERGRFDASAAQLRQGALLEGMSLALQSPLAGLDGLVQLLASGRSAALAGAPMDEALAQVRKISADLQALVLQAPGPGWAPLPAHRLAPPQPPSEVHLQAGA